MPASDGNLRDCVNNLLAEDHDLHVCVDYYYVEEKQPGS